MFFFRAFRASGLSSAATSAGWARFSAPWAGQNSPFAQLDADLQKLQTELHSLVAKSGVTVVDLNDLASDGQSIAGTGFWINPQNLQKTVTELATAVAGGTDTSQAKTDFNTLFSGSKVAQATIDKTFADLVQTIQDSKITSDDLTALAAAQAAVQNDRGNLPGGGRGLGGDHLGQAGPASLNSNLSLSLAAAGVATQPAQAMGGPGVSTPWGGGQNAQLSQLQTDVQTLQTENQGLAARSLVTVADLSNLAGDAQAIAGAGARPDAQGLQKVLKELATAVAGGADASQAKTDFNALFTGTSLAQTSIDKTFDDLVQTIQDSRLTAADLTTLAADQAAVQADWTALRGGTSGTSTGAVAGSGTAGGGTSGGSGSGTSTGSGAASTGTATHFARLRGMRAFGRFRRR